MRLGLVASAGIARLFLGEGLSEFVFAGRSRESSVPAARRAALRAWGSCSSGSPEVADATMSNTAAKGQRLTRAAMCVGGCVRTKTSEEHRMDVCHPLANATAVLSLRVLCAMTRFARVGDV